MKVDYVARGYAPDETVRRYTEDKLRKVAKFLEEPIEVHVTLDMEKHLAVAELHVTHRHGPFHVRETAEQMLDAVNLAVDKLETQVERNRKKHVDKRRRAQREEVAGREEAAATPLSPEA
jgi:putative sigma-54 modulation protein